MQSAVGIPRRGHPSVSVKVALLRRRMTASGHAELCSLFDQMARASSLKTAGSRCLASR
jgi:hypothetical protein